MKTTKSKKGSSPFSKILTGLLTEKKIKLTQAAKACSIPVSTLHDWKSGNTPPTDYEAVLRLAQYLGCSFTYLLTGQNEPTQQAPRIEEVFTEGEIISGFCEITIKRLIPRKPK